MSTFCYVSFKKKWLNFKGNRIHIPNALVFNLLMILKALLWPNSHIYSWLFGGSLWFRKALPVKTTGFQTPRAVCMRIVWFSASCIELLWIQIPTHRKSRWHWFPLWQRNWGWRSRGRIKVLLFWDKFFIFHIVHLKKVF